MHLGSLVLTLCFSCVLVIWPHRNKVDWRWVSHWATATIRGWEWISGLRVSISVRHLNGLSTPPVLRATVPGYTDNHSEDKMKRGVETSYRHLHTVGGECIMWGGLASVQCRTVSYVGLHYSGYATSRPSTYEHVSVQGLEQQILPAIDIEDEYGIYSLIECIASENGSWPIQSV